MVRTETTGTASATETSASASTAITAEKASSATAYETLVEAEKTAHTIEIREISTGKDGVANTCEDGIAVFYGADDGSDDTIISPEEFNQRFEITAIITD